MNGAVTISSFGALSVRLGGEEPVELGGPKPRLLLALLLSRANAVYPVDALIEAVWSGRPPRTARKNLQVYVCRLRRVLGARVVHTGGGYSLRLPAHECDLVRFEQLAREGRRLARAGAESAADLLGEALELWREGPLGEFGRLPCLAEARDRLEEVYLTTLEEWAELEVERGGHRLVVDRLQDVAVAHPLRERLAAAWMRALAAGGGSAPALAHFDLVRLALARELGVSPGPVLTALRRRLLTPQNATTCRAGNQLPRDIPDFVGRAEETRYAIEHFRRPSHDGAGRVMVVSGAVGVGKSAFAVRVGHLLADAFPDGMLLAELGDRPAGTVVRGLLDAVGLPTEQSVGQALAQWRSWIAGRRMLLVLDDAVFATVAEALLPGCGPSAALVTSRYRLSGLAGVEWVPLAPLTEREGLELLGRVVGPGRLAADPPAAARIVRRCEGLPLAVRIAGAKLNALRHLRSAEYADRLRDAPSLLDEMAAGELVLRERYEAFWRGLPPPQRAAFRRLAARTSPLRYEQVVADAEELLECSLLTPPAGEVSAHLATYDMSVFARDFARALPTG